MQTQLLFQSNIAILKIQGHLNRATAHIFNQQSQQAFHQSNISTLIVDLSHVESLDSAGLMALVAAYRLAKSLNTKFNLSSVTPELQMILELSRLDQVFEIIDNPIVLFPQPQLSVA